MKVKIIFEHKNHSIKALNDYFNWSINSKLISSESKERGKYDKFRDKNVSKIYLLKLLSALSCYFV